MTDAIVVEGLEKSYGSVRALCGVDFSARTGSVLGLLGPNGALRRPTLDDVFITLTGRSAEEEPPTEMPQPLEEAA
jgi:ABC-type uncharacterized transport system ATPase subunit